MDARCSRARGVLGSLQDLCGSLIRTFLCESRAPSLPPGVELRAKCKNRSQLVVQMAVNRHCFTTFPPLHGTDVAL